MKKITFPLLLLWLASASNLYAQDQRVYSQFFMNPYVLNSAYAGSAGYTTIYGVHRQQWIGLEGAPMNSHVSFHTPLESNFSIGAFAYNDNVDAINSSGAKITGGYLMELDRRNRSYIRFGLSVGGGYSGYDIEAGNDPTLLALTGTNTSYVTADVGLSYYFRDFNVGLSIPNLIGRDVVSPDAFSSVQLKPWENIMINANYRFLLNKSLAIEPHLIYRFSLVNMPQYEAAVMAHLGHIVWAGLSYREDLSMAALFGIKIQERYAIGFSYEYGNTELEGYSSGTLEVSLGINVGDKKKKQKQGLSFIQNFKKTREQEMRSEARRQQLAEQRAQQQKEQQTAQTTPEPKETPVTPDPVVEETAVVANTTPVEEKEVVNEQIDMSIPIKTRTNTEGEWEIGTTYIQTHMDSTKASIVKWTDALTNTPPEVALPENTHRMGRHILELPPGHHVVAGEFDDFQSAEDYSDEIFQMGYHGAIVAYVSSMKQYVVVVHKGATMRQAEEEQAVWSARHNLDHVYILNILE
ncbi:PorP/SprF family type IX secretion system membrane protein [Reichenbachiella ulvae]|uniref:Type IX secretion system membrane protein PorP/SprF n=1 Tax=Reichenbachiella ulvae TaxID=2980104 RepID=A0ABT3CP86_9BACT|nr:type IX secretion system membrane protein PorP/SprF [Reichenbachiella ulvae]MCV9385427.1 type IX secretion system membrane protein PorP/SprF [Reichenbachiella ulvae]